MDYLSVEDRAKLEAKIMEAITDVLEHADDSGSENTSSGSIIQGSTRTNYFSEASESNLSPSAVEEAGTAGRVAKLDSMRRMNSLRKQISEQKRKLNELNLEMQIEQAKAEQDVFFKCNNDPSKPSTSTREYYDRLAPKTRNANCDVDAKIQSTRLVTENEQFRNRDSLQLFRRMHLPKMTMDTFDGDIMKFGSFLRQFENNIASKTDDEEEKLYYLEQMTTGKPNDIVKTCLHLSPGEGYREARRLLEIRYGDKSKVATSLVTKILAWPNIRSNDAPGLDEFAIFLRGCLNSLKNIHHGIAEVDARTIRRILGRLPPDATDKWRDAADYIEVNQNRCSNFEDFVLFIERLARVANNPWYGKQFFSSNEYRDDKETKVKSMAGSHRSSSFICKFCNGLHDTAECEKNVKHIA